MKHTKLTALILCFTMMFSITSGIFSAAFASDSTTGSAYHLDTTTGSSISTGRVWDSTTGSAYKADNSIKLFSTKSAITTPSASEYEANIGKIAVFNIAEFSSFLMHNNPASFDYYGQDGELDFVDDDDDDGSDWDNDTYWLMNETDMDIPDMTADNLMVIVDYYWDEDTTALWYQVEAADGSSLPAKMTAGGYDWLLQDFTDPELASDNALILSNPPVAENMVGKTVQFKTDIAPILYASIGGTGYGTMSSVPDAMIVIEQHTDENGVVWYYVDAVEGESWPKDCENFHYVKADDVIVEADDTENIPLTHPNYPGISVSGKFENDVELSIEDATLAEIVAIDPSLSDISEQRRHIAFDISLMNSNGNYRPAEPVTVSMDVSTIGSDGDPVLVFHVHENVDAEGVPAVETEMLGPFLIEQGKISFEIDRFSYILVINSNTKIEGVKSFYPVGTYAEDGTFPESTNGNWCIVGVYYDKNEDGHVLIGQITNNIGAQKVDSVTVNGVKIENDGTNIIIHGGTATKLQLMDETTTSEVINFSSLKNKYVNAIWDVLCNDVMITEVFKLSLESGAGGFDIGETEYDLYLEYSIEKLVAAGTSAEGVTFDNSITANRGDWLIFKIVVNNTGTAPLSGMTVRDILPVDTLLDKAVFDMTTAQMSIDGENGEIGSWEPFKEALFENYSSAGGFSRELYVKAQIRPDLEISTDKAYINKASISGTNMPTAEDTATIYLNAPSSGTLTVSKAVTSENPKDPAPDTPFTFTVHSNVANAGPFSYTKSDGTAGSVANNGTFENDSTSTNDGTFTLKNGESIVFSDFPVGDFTITERKIAGYNTKINGTDAGLDTQGNPVYTGSMTSQASPVVAFENQFATRMATLSISKKVEQEYLGDTPEIPADGFEFTVVFGDGTDTTTSYPYTKSEGTTGTITSGGTIKLGDDQTAVITDIPVGTAYTVTENLSDLSDDYTTTVNGATGVTASATMQLGNNTVDVVNTYMQHFTDLTITKSGSQAIDENQSFIFDVEGVTGTDTAGYSMTVVIHGDNSVTIKDLQPGAYIVTEQTNWSWRYTDTPDWSFVTDGNTDASGKNNAVATITLGASGNVITFTNNRSKIYWLDGGTWCDNLFDGTNTTDTPSDRTKNLSIAFADIVLREETTDDDELTVQLA